jgi:DNA-binding response OmpR family regulator
MRVLLVEDDVDMLDISSYALRKHGYEVIGVTDGATALHRWETEQPDIVLLDVNLPTMSGMDVCRAIRKRSSTPIIIMSSFGDEAHIVEGFENGADDFVTKPVSYRELGMRMRAILQRKSDTPTLATSTTIVAGNLCVDLANCEVRIAGELVGLTRLEARALYFLVSNVGHVVQSQRLIELIWNYDGGDAFSLKTHISHIRHKLGVANGTGVCITSVPRIGYRLEAAA